TNLVALEVSENDLTELPREIGQLTGLMLLDVSRNRLTSLPAAIGQLPNLATLRVDHNPLTAPPPEVVERGTNAILMYLRAQQKHGMRRLWYSKMVLVGEGGVGKTALLRALRGYPFRQELESTRGMDALMRAHEAFELPHPENGDVKMRLYVWDF